MAPLTRFRMLTLGVLLVMIVGFPVAVLAQDGKGAITGQVS